MDDSQSKLYGSSRTRSLTSFLLTLFFIFCLAGLLAGLWFSFRDTPEDALPGQDAIVAILAILLGFGIGVLCWATAWLLRKPGESIRIQREILRQLRDIQINREQSPPAAAEANYLRESEKKLDEILRELRDMNENIMLTEQQRRAKQLRREACLAEMLSEEISQAISAQQFDEAIEILARLTEVLGDDPRVQELDQQISRAREMKLQAVMQDQSQRASDLMALAKFDEALGLARELQQQFPQADEADSLLERVQREAQTFEAEQCSRLFEEINSAGEARQWKASLAAAHRLLENHKDSQEAKKVRTMLPTLVDNARIEEVRELRDRILNMIERRRYSEAIELADHVVENFPETTAAAELRDQLPKLRQRAAGH